MNCGGVGWVAFLRVGLSAGGWPFFGRVTFLWVSSLSLSGQTLFKGDAFPKSAFQGLDPIEVEIRSDSEAEPPIWKHKMCRIGAICMCVVFLFAPVVGPTTYSPRSYSMFPTFA